MMQKKCFIQDKVCDPHCMAYEVRADKGGCKLLNTVDRLLRFLPPPARPSAPAPVVKP